MFFFVIVRADLLGAQQLSTYGVNYANLHYNTKHNYIYKTNQTLIFHYYTINNCSKYPCKYSKIVNTIMGKINF